ncbi:MAG: TIGR00341 family protein [Nitrospinaceae bacterium]|nr:TIGR00341 family protein [Nitrospinaceae bacterium]NIR56177.1 TIGR00341 family protein [Nitrospinaceae bacterium]NIS86633.1 TIGR00341 family protein [Nitrospinaceae bacterium]NIT83466.1 TIGR00341 family protein [Nitrospinaceae bacterium]NIU45671.1 TIGR00341 family protein [Nitrospinaceae bacterium]
MKIIEVFADTSYRDIITTIADQHEARDCWEGPQGEDGRLLIRLVVGDEQRQAVMDALQGVLGNSPSAKIVVISVEAVLPRVENGETKKSKKAPSGTTTREELYNSIEKNARLTGTYLALVFLSTIVVAIGLLEDNVAVVIGAMVIAPLLGPNLALALGAALGDTSLIWESLKTGTAGFILALGLSILIGELWHLNFDSHELLARTDVGLDSIALALASGTAAVLSMSTGLPSVLVGVMVAVALLPPTATMGLMIGAGKFKMAAGAGLLLAVNVVSVNLSAKVTFLARGITPRTWLEKQKARQSITTYIMFWVVTLAILVVAIYLRHRTL